MAQKLKPNRSDNRGGSRIGSGAKPKGNVAYKRNIKPEHVVLMDAYLATLKASLLVLMLVSCGRRTTHTTHTSIKNDSLQISQNIELTQNATFSDIGTVRPFDASKPMLWGGAWHYNTVIQFDKTISSGLDIQSGESLSYQGEEQSGETHNTDRKNSGHIYLILSAVIGTLFVLYLTLKKYIP